MNENTNDITTTTNNKVPPTRWEDIIKVKLRDYPRKEDVTNKLKTAGLGFKKSNYVDIVETIYYVNCRRIAENQPLEKHGNLLNIVASPDMLLIAHKQISTNKGAMSEGSEGSTADNTSMDLINTISQKILSGEFKWSAVKRVMIPKPGKEEKRPLGLPDYSNKLVQASIRTVLYAIYEPEMQHLNANAGFRPNHSCAMAIQDIIDNAKGTDLCIEGDIKGAFDNVDHKIRIKILLKRIKDKNFLKLIYDGLKSGMIHNNNPSPTIIGIPQGGIASPYLFNIYMHEFDKYVIEEIKVYYEQEILIKKHQIRNDQVTSNYETLGSRLQRTRQKLKQIPNSDQLKSVAEIAPKLTYESLIEIINLYPQEFKPILKNPEDYQEFRAFEAEFTNNPPAEEAAVRMYQRFRNKKNNPNPKQLDQYTPAEIELIKRGNARINRLKRAKKNITDKIIKTGINFPQIYQQNLNRVLSVTKTELLSTPYYEPSKKKIKIYYKRYADDWTLWIRGDMDTAEEIKEKIAKYLKEELKLTLSTEKTKITNFRTHLVKFLGFQIHYQTNPLIRRRPLRIGDEETYTQRFSTLQVHPDIERLDNTFLSKEYVAPKGHPREVGFLTVLNAHEIVEKYNSFMLGLGTYYYSVISYKSRLNKYHYILYYSCIKTLATKLKISVRTVIERFGYRDISIPNALGKTKATDFRICIPYQRNGYQYWAVLINYKEFMQKLNQITLAKIPPPNEVDFQSLHKVNYRTAFKLQTACAICNSTDRIQAHHIKPIKHKGGKFTGYRGFDKVVASLGRKQIPVCHQCHVNIHNGKYNGMSLNEIYDVRLVAPEAYIKIDTISTNKNTNVPLIQPERKKLRNEVVIDEQNRTYYNPLLKQFLEQKIHDYNNNNSDT